MATIKPFNSIGGYAVGESAITVVDANSNVTVSEVSASGNIIGNYLHGDGSNITNLPTQSLLANVNSNVSIPSENGNVYLNANNGTDYQWNFDTSGVLTLPNSVHSFSYIQTPTDVPLNIQAQGTNLSQIELSNSGLVAYTNNGTNSLQFDNNGNLYVSGNVWGNSIYTKSISTDGLANLLAISAGTNNSGLIQFDAGQFQIQTTTNPNPVFQVNSDGTTQILAPTFANTLGALNISGTTDGNTLPPNQLGVMAHITGQPGSPTRVYLDGSSSYAAYIGRRFNGNVNTPTAVLDSQIMTRFGATPFNDGASNGWPSISATRMDMVANGIQTESNLGSRVEFWTTPLNSNVIAKNLTIDSNGLTFIDGSQQNTAGIPLTYMGAANGVATLGADGKVTSSQLPAGAVVYKGTWDASTNTPTLTNGTGSAGDEYSVITAGTTDFGAGNISFNVGDFVIYSGAIWQKITGGSGVISFNGRTGDVVLSSGDVGNALGYTAYNGATNPNGYVNTSQAANAAPVQSFNGRIGSISLLTSDVTGVLTANSITNTMLAGPIPNGKLANSDIILGNTTLNLGATVTSVSGLTSITASTGNITTVNTVNLNVTGTSNLNSNANVKITGGSSNQVLTTDGTGNLSWTSLAPTPATYVAANANSYTVDFTNNSLVLLYQPTGNVNLTLTNYTAGKSARVMIRFGSTNYPINLGILSPDQSTEGKTTLPISGAGGHNTKANSTVQLLYTCFDSTAGNCYVAATFF